MLKFLLHIFYYVIQSLILSAYALVHNQQSSSRNWKQLSLGPFTCFPILSLEHRTRSDPKHILNRRYKLQRTRCVGASCYSCF